MCGEYGEVSVDSRDVCVVCVCAVSVSILTDWCHRVCV